MDDVVGERPVELAVEVGRQVQQVVAGEGDVGQPAAGPVLLGDGDALLGDVAAVESAVGEAAGQLQQQHPGAAAEVRHLHPFVWKKTGTNAVSNKGLNTQSMCQSNPNPPPQSLCLEQNRPATLCQISH